MSAGAQVREPATGPRRAHLAARLVSLEQRVAEAVTVRRAGDPEPDDRFRGLYVSDAHADRLLADPPGLGIPPPSEDTRRARASADTTAADDSPLARLEAAFGLDEIDSGLLIVALAPDVDPRFERLYGYLNDDVSRRRATVALALELCGVDGASGEHRRRLGPDGALVAGGLLLIEEHDRPVLGRELRVPDRVVGHLLGDTTNEPTVARLEIAPATCEDLAVASLERAMGARVPLVYLRDGPDAAGLAAAATALRRAGREVLAVDLDRLDPAWALEPVAVACAREARLRGAGLVAGPVEALADRGAPAVATFAELGVPVVLTGSRSWDPGWSRRDPLCEDAPRLPPESREALWRDALDVDVTEEVDLAAVTAPFRLRPEAIVRAARSASMHAAAADRPLQATDLQAGARAQNAAGLERLARRIEPGATWDELVLPEDAASQLHELAARARHRDLVLDTWRMGRTASKGRGVAALFAGESGTGKTMSAEVLAADLGLELYVVDLSTVVDKYIGETEKNLDRIFGEADGVNGVLLFDEADALFGKRSEVSDAKDRYANVEVAYLLQRMERFDGVAVLTTNLRSNVDEAFTRRLDVIVDFPVPDEAARRTLWDTKLRPELPRADDVDLDFLARAFRLSGGEIRNVAVTAAYLAASGGTEVTMADLVRGVEREYQKLGRLCLPEEFGPWFDVIRSASPGRRSRR